MSCKSSGAVGASSSEMRLCLSPALVWLCPRNVLRCSWRLFPDERREEKWAGWCGRNRQPAALGNYTSNRFRLQEPAAEMLDGLAGSAAC